MKILAISMLGAMGLMAVNSAWADCAADATISDVKQAYARGQQLEKAGDARGALGAYVAAQEYTCDPNPVAADAARRAAVIAKPLGDAAKAKGDHAAAFDFYERGGHFAAADQALVARIHQAPDDSTLYAESLRHTRYRALPAFQANEAVRIKVTGAYTLDPDLLKVVETMPVKATERALAAEDAAFDEAWMAEYVALMNGRPQNPADFGALQEFAGTMQAFQARHRKDPLQDPLDAMAQLRKWESQVIDNTLAATLARRRAGRAEARATLLAQKYAAAPKLLELAIDYLGHSSGDSSAQRPRVLKVRHQAEALGDAAVAAKRYQLAIEYFSVAGASNKEDAANAQLQAMARQQMQPSIEAMQREAEALQARFSDPQMIAEMQRQAQEAQRALQSGAKDRKPQAAGNSADDLAAQLGL